MGASASDPAPSRLQAELRPLAKRKLKYVSCKCPSHVPHQLSRLPITPEKLSSSFRAADRSMVRPRSSEGPTCADTLPDSDRKPPSSLAESSSSVAPVSALHVTGRGHAHRRLVSFNGAGAGWPRKTITSIGFGGSAPSFNGAGAGWPRKTPVDRTHEAERDRFNGAGAGWPRKT